MERLLGRKFWQPAFIGLIGLPTATASLATYAPEEWQWSIDPVIWVSWLPVVFAVLLFFMYWKRTWRLFWRMPLLGGWLKRNVFPDLNGEWRIVTTSNWPRQEALAKAAAAKGAVYVPRNDGPVALGTFSGLTATIEQDWTDLSMTIRRPRKAEKDEAGDDKGFVIDSSRTLSFDLLRPSADFPEPRIAYFYRQENRPGDMVDSNDRYFLGAAILKVVDDDTLDGDYMTNQAWLKGLNAAGTVRLERVK